MVNVFRKMSLVWDWRGKMRLNCQSKKKKTKRKVFKIKTFGSTWAQAYQQKF
jgi:hypothetical protein